MKAKCIEEKSFVVHILITSTVKKKNNNRVFDESFPPYDESLPNCEESLIYCYAMTNL